VDRLLFLNPAAGLVGNEVATVCNDGFVFVSAEAQIAFGFEPPTAGLVEVLIGAQSTIGTHHVQIDDEFGFSMASCRQRNALMMNVLHPNVPEPSLALMSKLDQESDGGDVNVDRENLTRGQHFFAQLFSSGPVPAGHSVVVTIGTRTTELAGALNMKVHSRTNFQWFISSVEVRIAP
jgi:hypothetical protein